MVPMNNPRDLKIFDRPSRKICRDHLAFFLGYLEGVEVDVLTKKYLDHAEYTGAKVKSLIRWLQDEFSIAAMRADEIALAEGRRPLRLSRLIRINPDLLRVSGETLEKFAAKADPTGFYSEAELLEKFQEGHEVDRKDKRNTSLRQRIIKAVRMLAQDICTEPSRLDLLRYWFDEAIVERFANAPAPLITVWDLIELIDLRGRSWWRSVPKIGKVNAERIEGWMQRNGLLPDPEEQNTSVMIAQRTPFGHDTFMDAQALVPMERLIPPPALSGASGTNRGSGGTITAQNDLEAVEAWLRSLTGKHTLRSYRTHAERFILWSLVEKNKAMSSITIDDATDYRNFLMALRDCNSHEHFLDMQQNLFENGVKWEWAWTTPLDQWIGIRNAPRRSRAWKPFNGRLSASSCKLSFVVLKSMCQWLTDQKYLNSNPFAGVSAPIAENKIKINHSLNPDQIDFVVGLCDKLDHTEATLRLRAALILAFGTGMRLSELVSARVSMNKETQGVHNYGLKPSEDGEGWDIDVIGKGGKSRLVPVSDRVMDALADYMEKRGFQRDPLYWPEGTPLLSTLKVEGQSKRRVAGGMPVSCTTLARIITDHLEWAAELTETDRDKGRLRSFTVHWTRHSFATKVLNKGAGIDVVQELLGHASSATTSIYTNADRKRKAAAVALA
jgi:site-specific recombinase XerD